MYVSRVCNFGYASEHHRCQDCGRKRSSRVASPLERNPERSRLFPFPLPAVESSRVGGITKFSFEVARVTKLLLLFPFVLTKRIKCKRRSLQHRFAPLPFSFHGRFEEPLKTAIESPCGIKVRLLPACLLAYWSNSLGRSRSGEWMGCTALSRGRLQYVGEARASCPCAGLVCGRSLRHFVMSSVLLVECCTTY